MPSILLVASEEMGAARHFVSIAEALLARGHRVSVISAPAARQWYSHLDVRFHPAPEVPVTDMLEALPPVMQRSRQVYSRVKRVIEPMAAQWDVVRREIHDRAIDLVISDALFLGGAALSFAPTALRPPVIIVGAFPPWMPDPALPPYGMGAIPSDRGIDGLYSAIFRLIAAPAYASLSRAFNAQVQRTFGVRTRGDIRETPSVSEAWVQLTVPRFEYPRTILPPNFRFVGPLHPPASGSLPDWWDPMLEPPVIGVRADRPTAVRDLVLPTIRAFGGQEETVVIAGASRAATEAASERELPSNIHFEDQMPWPRLIPQRSVVITDGDYLHTQHALRYGIPVIVTGTLVTDMETGARVAWTEAGIALRRRRPDPAAIRHAVKKIRNDSSYRAAAARIAVQIDRTDAEQSICGLVEELAGTYV